MRKIVLNVSLACLLLGSAGSAVAQKPLEGHITLSGAFALYPLAVQWAGEFKKENPKVRIDISAGGAGKGMTDALSGMVDIGMVSRDVYPEETSKGAYAIAVAKDAVVAVMNASNPIAKEILAKGLKPSVGGAIWITGSAKTWGQAFGINKNIPLHVYTRSDACGASEIWAKFFGKKQEDLLGSGVFGDPGLALAVKKDRVGIGYNNIAYAYDFKTKRQLAGIRVIPVDVNNNGKIDANENFYNTMGELVKAISEGKYPSPPARELFFVTKGKPNSKLAKEFIKWVLTKGQKYVAGTGYVGLPKAKIDKQLKALK